MSAEIGASADSAENQRKDLVRSDSSDVRTEIARASEELVQTPLAELLEQAKELRETAYACVDQLNQITEHYVPFGNTRPVGLQLSDHEDFYGAANDGRKFRVFEWPMENWVAVEGESVLFPAEDDEGKIVNIGEGVLSAQTLLLLFPDGRCIPRPSPVALQGKAAFTRTLAADIAMLKQTMSVLDGPLRLLSVTHPIPSGDGWIPVIGKYRNADASGSPKENSAELAHRIVRALYLLKTPRFFTADSGEDGSFVERENLFLRSLGRSNMVRWTGEAGPRDNRVPFSVEFRSGLGAIMEAALSKEHLSKFSLAVRIGEQEGVIGFAPYEELAVIEGFLPGLSDLLMTIVRTARISTIVHSEQKKEERVYLSAVEKALLENAPRLLTDKGVAEEQR